MTLLVCENLLTPVLRGHSRTSSFRFSSALSSSAFGDFLFVSVVRKVPQLLKPGLLKRSFDRIVDVLVNMQLGSDPTGIAKISCDRWTCFGVRKIISHTYLLEIAFLLGPVYFDLD